LIDYKNRDISFLIIADEVGINLLFLPLSKIKFNEK